MDPVSRSLAEIERQRLRFLPYIFLAIALHIGVVAGVFELSRRQPAPRAAFLPTVSVRLVPPQREPRRQRTTPVARAAPTPLPQPTALPPEPTALPEPVAVPTAPPTEPDAPLPSDDAMPELGAQSTPRPSPTPNAGVVSRSGGLRLGGASESAEPAVPSDFHFTYYLQRMLALIESRWYKPPVPPGTSARARFTIQSNGQLQGIVLEQTSRNSSFDRAVLRALYAANPLPPLPPAYQKPTLTIHLTFSDSR